MHPPLTTARLLLRPFDAADAPRVQQLAGDARIADTTTTIPHPYPDGAAEAWIAAHRERSAAGTELTCAVQLRATGELIGCISLVDIHPTHARAELGYWIGVAYWRQGYASEAAVALVRHAHEALGCTRIVARCVARNGASAAVLRRAGLVREGLLPQHLLKNGRCEDLLLFGLNRPERGAPPEAARRAGATMAHPAGAAAGPHPPPFAVQRIDHVVFRVRDVDASVGFYERVVGGTVERRRPELGLVHVRVGASMVDLVAVDGVLGRAGGAGPAAEGRNVDHLCLRIEPFDEPRIVEHLARHGLAPQAAAGRNFGAEGEGLSLYVRDPDGNVIEFKGPATAAR